LGRRKRPGCGGNGDHGGHSAFVWKQVRLLLTVAGSSPFYGNTLTITLTGTNSFSVNDGTNAVTVPAGLVGGLRIVNTLIDDKVLVDLAGGSFAGWVQAYLGAGNDKLTVQNGTIANGLWIYGQAGTDDISLTSIILPTGKPTVVALDGSGDDSLTIDGGSQLLGDLVTSLANTINLQAGSAVGQNMTVYGGAIKNDITIDGTVGDFAAKTGDLSFYSAASTTNNNTITISGTVGRDFRMTASAVQGTGNVVTLTSTAVIGRDVSLAGTAKADTITLEAGAVITRDLALFFTAGGGDLVTLGVGGPASIGRTAYVYFGAGINTLNVNSTIGAGGIALAFYVTSTSTSGDKLNFLGGSIIGKGSVRLGSGGDKITYAGTTFDVLIDGGAGTETVTGAVPANVKQSSIP